MQKKYRVIIKADRDKFVKYRCSDLLSLVRFLDRQWPLWRWFNVYDKQTGDQIANYTKHKRPTSKQVH